MAHQMVRHMHAKSVGKIGQQHRPDGVANLSVLFCRCPVQYCRGYSLMIPTSTGDTSGCRDHERISTIVRHVVTTTLL